MTAWKNCAVMGIYRETQKYIDEICKLQDHINIQEMKIDRPVFVAAEAVALDID